MNIFSKELLMAIKSAGGVAKIACSDNTTWVLLENGDLYGCGSGYYGQQGDGTTGSGARVTTFTKRASNIKDVSCSGYATWYITKNGDLYGCGSGQYGQQGNGSTSNVTTFTKRASNVVQVVCSKDASYFTTWYIDNNGDLYGCGSGRSGQQGNGSTSDVTTFTKRASNVSQVACSQQTTWYITKNGDLYGCGYGSSGQQGNGSSSNVTTFTKRASNVATVLPAYNKTLYLDNNGDLYATGIRYYDASIDFGVNALTFSKIASNIKQAVCSSNDIWYIDNSNRLYGDGSNNSYGQLGNGTTNLNQYYDSVGYYFGDPVKTNIAQVVCSEQTTWYIDNNGDLYGCGKGGEGQQGSGGTFNVVRFIEYMESENNISQVVCSGFTTWCIDDNGNLYGCGYGGGGTQGNGTTTNQLTFENKMQYIN